jgi:hypothetical protein
MMGTRDLDGRSKKGWTPARLGVWLICVTVLSVLITGCGTGTPGTGVQESPLVMDSSVPSATIAPTQPSTASAAPTLPPTATPTSTASPSPAPLQLVVLHTNDNWGETEPCG